MSVKVHEPVCLDSAQDKFFWFDHFLGDQLKDEWRSTGHAGGSAVVVDQQDGGIVRITCDSDLNDEWYIDWNNIRSLHVTKKASMEVRAKCNTTTLILFLMVLRFDVNNWIGIYAHPQLFANWQAYTIDGGASTAEDTGIALDTSEHIFRIECHTHGGNHVHFYIDGTETNNSPISTNVPDDAADFLQPYLNVTTKEVAVAKSADIDYVVVRQDR